MALLDSVRKAIEEGDGDFLRETVHLLAQGVMEAEVTEITGVPKGERAPDRRLTSRNGYRDRRWDTRVGTIDLAIPRVRTATTSPRSSNPVGEPNEPCSRSSRRHTFWASRPAGSTTWSRVSASPASARAKSAASAPRSMPKSRPSGGVHSPTPPIPTSGSTRRI